MQMEESRTVPDEQPNTLGSDAQKLLELSAHIYTQINPCEGNFGNRIIIIIIIIITQLSQFAVSTPV